MAQTTAQGEVTPARTVAITPLKEVAAKRLTKEELRQRLRLNFGGLVEEIHALAVRQNQAEDQREPRLDAKAQGLLGTAGLSLTVAFTFGALLLQHPSTSRRSAIASAGQ